MSLPSITTFAASLPSAGSSCENYSKTTFVRGRDTGASIAAYHQGKLVFDLSGGWFDQAQTIPYNNNTLQLVYSASKGVVAAAVALCVQQGLLDYSALVTKYWPEFGQNGKQNTTVEDIVSHRAGLPDSAMPFERYLDWTEMTRSLEQQRPVWPPGSAQGYHGLSYGWLAGELVRRVDPKKRTFGKLIHDEIATRLDAELYIGLPEAKESRVSPLVFQNIQNFLGESMSHIYGVFNEERAHQAEIPGANCITNARSMAKMYASLIGDVNGQPGSRLLREDILRQAVKKSKGPANEIDLTVKFPFPFAMGFMLYDQTYPSLGSSVFGHTGNHHS